MRDVEEPSKESEAELFDCLRRLGLIKISVEILKVTAIGRAISDLRKHNSKRIHHIVRTLIIKEAEEDTNYLIV
ncbi:hypothetical protein QJS10_CPA03g02032 [Acorus calamus]|uniref:TFIIS N-terminal domain-containing protein n=1 Tax=Acorus calamus TaxID=4465 RepID=A0AAV9FCZ5_ACOCL|nr:hypothetical protein QJS10_CPA03g02032 [Acorus calamus]